MHHPVSTHLYENITGYWNWMAQDRENYVNPVLKAALGYEPHDFEDKLSEWKKIVFPEDLLKIYDAFKKHIESKGKVYVTQEVRFLQKNGSTAFILFTGRVTGYTFDGKPSQVFGSHVDLTAQRKAEKELQQTRDFLKRTSQVAMVGAWELDLVNQKVMWTDVTRQIFDVPDNFEPMPGTSALFFKEGSDRDTLLEAYHNAVENGVPYDLELRIETTAGSIKWTRIVGQPEFENGVCIRLYGIFQDITTRKNQDEALRQKQLQLETFIKHSPVQLAMLDKEFKYIAASDLWLKSYKLDLATLVGRSHFDVFPNTPEIWRVYLGRCLRGEVIKREEDSLYRMDGREKWLRWEIRPWYEIDGGVGGIIIFTEEITEKRETQLALIKAKEDAEEAAIAKARFLSVMSHEIRTPMNGVIGFTNLLLQNPRDDQREALNVLKFSAQNLMVIINDVLDLNKIDAGKLKIENISFNLKQLLHDVCKAQEQDAKEKQLNLHVQFDTDLPLWMRGDPVRIGQVITNLVSNAIKFTAVGKINISTALIEDKGSTINVGFAVSDTGIGIPEDKQEYIFEMFNQAETDTTRVYGGTGLGLTITRRLLQIMGSNIQLKSTPGQGSIFFFELELKKSSEQLIQPNLGIAGGEIENLKGIKILITDDNPVNVLVVKRFLQRWQAEYDIAENGQIAFDKVQANNYHLVLMDLKMPVMDGYQATEAIRNLPGDKYKNLPIIALTASVLADNRDDIINSGMNDYIAKPFNPVQLYERIKQYTKPR